MNRLCSLDTIVQQEKEHLRNSVSRIKQYEPDVVMVERTVRMLWWTKVESHGKKGVIWSSCIVE